MSVMQRVSKTSSGAGFTLVELLVVITIIGILSGLIGVNLVTVRAKARDNQRQADLAALAVALETYRSDRRQYPVQTSGFGDATIVLRPVLVGKYISAIPTDPKAPTLVYRYATNAATISDGIQALPKPPGSFFAIDATLEQAPTEFASLEAGMSVADNSKRNFFLTGFYSDAGVAHYRLSNK